jgi:hypothetical protein
MISIEGQIKKWSLRFGAFIPIILLQEKKEGSAGKKTD